MHAGSNRYVATFLQLGKETGARAGEIFGLDWVDIDFERKTVNITAEKGSNPRILRITFHILRHWKATMEYHKTKDILHVQQLLGHKSIKNTLLYTQLVNLEEDEYVCRVARTPRHIQELIENGFEYICEQEDLKFFRRRK